MYLVLSKAWIEKGLEAKIISKDEKTGKLYWIGGAEVIESKPLEEPKDYSWTDKFIIKEPKK